MSSAIFSSVNLVAYLALFAGVGIVFLFANMFLGRFLRPFNPEPEKLEIYECGEPTIGSGFVQFDLRFYVVALLFIIFDVEVAFFFPWAGVFGKATNLMQNRVDVVASSGGQLSLTPTAEGIYRELGVRNPVVPTTAPASLAAVVESSSSAAETSSKIIHEGFRQLAWVTVVDIAVFFAILLIGFAYVWKRGDLDWVRAVSQERGAERKDARESYDPLEEDQFVSA
jgi:NADH-quinone oxidoreductase subunit A